MRFELANLITGVAIPPGHSSILRTFSSIELQKVVIEQDTDLLTDKEMRKHRSEVVAAVYEELELGSTTIASNAIHDEALPTS